MRIDFLATRQHFADHLAPLAAEARRRGHTVDEHISYSTLPAQSVVVASATGDLRKVGRRHFRVLTQHGVGQSYNSRHSSYPGGRGLGAMDLMLLPNQQAADMHLRFYPRARVAVVGSPRVDAESWRLGADPAISHVDGRPVVAITWHWNCVVAGPYSGSAFPVIGRTVLARLVEMRDRGEIALVGHAHPRAWGEYVPIYESLSIPMVPLHMVLECSLLIADNTSVLYEFPAITGRPVVVLDSPRWDESVSHGLRFWSHADVGLRTRDPDEVPEVVRRALDDHPSVVARRESIVADLFPHRGEAASRALDAIEAAAG